MPTLLDSLIAYYADITGSLPESAMAELSNAGWLVLFVRRYSQFIFLYYNAQYDQDQAARLLTIRGHNALLSTLDTTLWS